MTPCSRKRILSVIPLMLFALPALSVVNTNQQNSSNQQTTTQAASPVNSQALEERLRTIEAEQQAVRQAIKENKEDTRFLIGGFAALLVLTQFISGIFQARREDKAYQRHTNREDVLEARHAEQNKELETGRKEREDAAEGRRRERETQLFNFWKEREQQLEQRRVEREDRLDLLTKSSVESLNNVLEVVYRTFDERRKAEEAGQKAANDFNQIVTDLKNTIASLNNKIVNLEGLADETRLRTKNEELAIERRALTITTTTSRHQVRQRTSLFVDFAKDYDAFVRQYVMGSSNGQRFGVYVQYVRGIAAHYAGDPKLLTALLNSVVGDLKVQEGEDEGKRDKRRVVAFYYLGLTESNFGNYDQAIEKFREAIKLEDQRTPDVLSRLVAAEAAAFGNRMADAHGFLEEVEGIVANVKPANRSTEIAFRRHGYRAKLIRGNIAISGGREKWSEAVDLLHSISDSHEYYARATLAQVLEKLNPGSKDARELFSTSYQAIRDLRHLDSVIEPRSRILLLLVAGMCSGYTDGYTAMMEEHFVEAENLLSSLPERDGQVCTVFSPRMKKNVDRSLIQSDIDALRRGSLLSEA